MGTRALAILVGFLFAALAASPAPAASRVVTPHAETRLVAEDTGIAPGGSTWLMIDQTLAKGWHVYWRNPGDSGLPLDLEWRLPAGWVAGEAHYPAPERIPVGPFVNFGHHGSPAFLVPLSAPATAALGSLVEIGLTATWLICEDICVPETGEFTITLPVEAAPQKTADLRARFSQARLAAPEAFAGEAIFIRDDAGLRLQAEGPELTGAGGAFFFPAVDALVEPAAAQPFSISGERVTVAMTRGPAFESSSIDRLEGVLEIVREGARRSFSISARQASGAETIDAPARLTGLPAAGDGLGGESFLWLIAASFLGGALLNLMPCVFPILFIKAASFARAAAGNASEMRRHGLVYTGGVLISFVSLGGALLLLRAGGEQLGWGFHLQSPWVVALSAYVLFLVGLNLAGVFTVGESIQNVGGGLTAKGGDTGAFFTGVLAVIVAAPCIGPLLSAPMGAAVVLPPLAGMAIFATLGLGLAAPFLVLSFAPDLARRLPKPGSWMITFKQLLSFPVFGGAAFFLWVLAQQTGSSGLALGLAGLLFAGFGAWIFERAKTSRGARALALRAAAAGALLVALVPALRLEIAPAPASGGAYGSLTAVPFSADELAARRARGEAVFIDFTAAWCVTCQVTKVTLLSRPSVASAFAANNVSLMVADWTRRDPVITEALAAFGANGVPLYVYFPPRSDARVLPLPLTEANLLKTIAEQDLNSAGKDL